MTDNINDLPKSDESQFYNMLFGELATTICEYRFESLGTPYQQILYDNVWDLYEE